METLQLNIEGMHCGGCAAGVQMTTERLHGVASVFIDLEGKKGTWEIDPNRITSDEIINEIKRLGYTVSVA